VVRFIVSVVPLCEAGHLLLQSNDDDDDDDGDISSNDDKKEYIHVVF
jgi:hypothetical protein